jgi:hypothetical protein
MAKAKRSTSVSILFIGNSFTQRNNLPGLIAAMALQRGLTVQHELISAGGASLKRHWNAGAAARAIERGGYDYVVLQEQSTLPVKNAAAMAESVRLFDGAIKRAGSKTALYMTWARHHLPEQQTAIAEAYRSIGKELGAVVIPVGLAWQTFGSSHKCAVLYDADQSHPSLAGTYLAACVFLAVLLRINPVEVTDGPAGLDSKLAVEIQHSGAAHLDH